jgi:hypothetical protein
MNSDTDELSFATSITQRCEISCEIFSCLFHRFDVCHANSPFVRRRLIYGCAWITVPLCLQFCVNLHRSAGRIWLSRIGNVGIGNRRKRNVSGIFDGRRRWVRHRNFGWRRRWYVSRLMARLGRGRLGLLPRRVQVCQNPASFRGVAPCAVSCRVGRPRARSRKRSFAERVPSNGRRFGQKPSPSRGVRHQHSQQSWNI